MVSVVRDIAADSSTIQSPETTNPVDTMEESNLEPRQFYSGDIVVEKTAPLPTSRALHFGTVSNVIQSPLDDQTAGKSSSHVITIEENEAKPPIASTNIQVKWGAASDDPSKNNKEAAELSVVERNVGIGQKVRNEEGLLGTVVETKSKVAVSILGSTYVLENVPVERLKAVSVCVILFNKWIT